MKCFGKRVVAKPSHKIGIFLILLILVVVHMHVQYEFGHGLQIGKRWTNTIKFHVSHDFKEGLLSLSPLNDGLETDYNKGRLNEEKHLKNSSTKGGTYAMVRRAATTKSEVIERKLENNVQNISSCITTSSKQIEMPDSNPPAKYLFQNVDDINTFQQNMKDQQTNILELANANYVINCSNIHEVKLVDMVGWGNFKKTYKGIFQGREVAVKYPNRVFTNMTECVEQVMRSVKYKTMQGIRQALSKSCPNSTISNMLHETINHAIFNYPNVIKHLGYCINIEGTNKDDKNISDKSFVSVFEFGAPLNIQQLQKQPWVERVKHCRDIANLMEMFQFSILGSVRYSDFHARHFKMVNGRIHVIDLDDWVRNTEKKCKQLNEKLSSENIGHCSFNLTCVNNVCEGFNAKSNMHNFTDLFFKTLLSTDLLPAEVLNKYKYVFDGVHSYKYNATEIKNWFDKILVEFKDEHVN